MKENEVQVFNSQSYDPDLELHIVHRSPQNPCCEACQEVHGRGKSLGHWVCALEGICRTLPLPCSLLFPGIKLNSFSLPSCDSAKHQTIWASGHRLELQNCEQIKMKIKTEPLVYKQHTSDILLP